VFDRVIVRPVYMETVSGHLYLTLS
jgi:hypothetical protein